LAARARQQLPDDDRLTAQDQVACREEHAGERGLQLLGRQLVSGPDLGQRRQARRQRRRRRRRGPRGGRCCCGGCCCCCCCCCCCWGWCCCRPRRAAAAAEGAPRGSGHQRRPLRRADRRRRRRRSRPRQCPAAHQSAAAAAAQAARGALYCLPAARARCQQNQGPARGARRGHGERGSGRVNPLLRALARVRTRVGRLRLVEL